MKSQSTVENLLGSLSNFERTRPTQQQWSLDNMHALLKGRSLPGLAVQVGGSKGKGTTALYLESMAREAGLRTGVFLSPHLRRVNERIRLDGQEIEDGELLSALEALLAQARGQGVEPSYFEALTLVAHRIFADERVDLAVFEVGLGGRLDATTAVPVDASILTMVEREHTAVLGNEIESIAREKSFVVRAGKPAFTAATGSALAVIEARANEVGAALHRLPGELLVSDLDTKDGTLSGRLLPADRAFRLPSASRFELPAMVLSFACLTELFKDAQFSLDPVSRPELPGRFEVLHGKDGLPVVLDGAHTPESLSLVADELTRRFFERSESKPRVHAMFGTAVDKDWRSGLKPLLPLVDRWIVTEVPGTVAERPERIVAWLRSQGADVEVTSTVEEAGQLLMASDADVRLVTGSFYLAGTVRPLLLQHHSRQ